MIQLIVSIILIILSTLGIIYGVLYWLLQNSIGGLIIFGSLVFLILGIHLYDTLNELKIKQPTYIDLPEEWDQISHKCIKPDTLLGHIHNDTLYITFKH